MKINVMLDKGAIMPTKAHIEDDAGFDLYAPYDFVLEECQETPRAGQETIDTGVHMQIPRGYVGFIKSKSGLNVKHDIIADGTIDAGYTGSIIVKLYNLGSCPHTFKRGDKITQIVIQPVAMPTLELVDSLEDTDRGANGFGSSGI